MVIKTAASQFNVCWGVKPEKSLGGFGWVKPFVNLNIMSESFLSNIVSSCFFASVLLQTPGSRYEMNAKWWIFKFSAETSLHIIFFWNWKSWQKVDYTLLISFLCSSGYYHFCMLLAKVHITFISKHLLLRSEILWWFLHRGPIETPSPKCFRSWSVSKSL